MQAVEKEGAGHREYQATELSPRKLQKKIELLTLSTDTEFWFTEIKRHVQLLLMWLISMIGRRGGLELIVYLINSKILCK